MERTWIKLMITAAVLLAHSKTLGQLCTREFRRSLDRDLIPLVPLLRRTDTAGPEQWIFPEMQFTCRGNLTEWKFRGIPGRNVTEECRVHLTTWRRDTANVRAARYERTSTTEGNTANLIVNGQIFTYMLATPIQVEPGDIVGIETGTLCDPSQPSDNIQSLNIRMNGRFKSFRRNSGTTTFNLDGSTTVMERHFIPLIQDNIASGQLCTRGFRRALNRELVPLLRRTETTGPEQWIFPEMQFTCSASITTWNFRGISGQNIDEVCRVHLTTWRRDTANLLATQYERVSTTEGNTANFIVNGLTFTYMLATPVQVEPGDIVGIETGTSCGPSQPFGNIQSLNISGSVQPFTSFRRKSGTTTFNVNSSDVVKERDYIPLIQDTIGLISPKATLASSKPTEVTMATDLEDTTIQSGNAVAIAVGIVGGIIGLIALISVCICVGCLSRHVQLHVHYNGKKENDTDQREDTHRTTANPGDMVVQANAAYRKVPSNKEQTQMMNGVIVAEQGRWLSQSYQRTLLQGEAREDMEHQRERRERMSNNIAYNHRNQIKIEVDGAKRDNHFTVPLTFEPPPTPHQQRPLEDDEYHYYDYIL